MPARRLPWFKLWPEAMRHEKVVLLSDGAFRTWIVTLAAGSEQTVRWRFGSVKHLLSVTGRPEVEVRELIGARLLDVDDETGALWVHDWRQWQERYASDFAPRTLRNGSANMPSKLPGELRGESKELREETKTPPKPPPQAEGAIAPPTAEDRELWTTAREQVADGMHPANRERIEALELLGREADGRLRLRAPPWVDASRFVGAVRAALVNAGDEAGGKAVIVTG